MNCTSRRDTSNQSDPPKTLCLPTLSATTKARVVPAGNRPHYLPSRHAFHETQSRIAAASANSWLTPTTAKAQLQFIEWRLAEASG